MTIRIASLNTWQASAPYAERLQLMYFGIEALQPDVLLLQEVFTFVATADGDCNEYKSPNILQMLKQGLGYQSVVYPVRAKIRQYESCSVNSTSGLAILVKGDILLSREFELPAVPEDGDRNGLYAKVRVGDVVLDIFNTHLTHLDTPGELRIKQMETLLRLIDQTVMGNSPIILGGDFNADSASVILALAIEKGFTSFPYASDGPKGTLLGQHDAGHTRQVDHLLVRDVDSQIKWTPFYYSSLDSANEHGVYPSDHKLIFIETALS